MLKPTNILPCPVAEGHLWSKRVSEDDHHDHDRDGPVVDDTLDVNTVTDDDDDDDVLMNVVAHKYSPKSCRWGTPWI